MRTFEIPSWPVNQTHYRLNPEKLDCAESSISGFYEALSALSSRIENDPDGYIQERVRFSGRIAGPEMIQLSEAACDPGRRTLVVNPVSHLPCPNMVSDTIRKAVMRWALGPDPQDIGLETFSTDTLERYPAI